MARAKSKTHHCTAQPTDRGRLLWQSPIQGQAAGKGAPYTAVCEPEAGHACKGPICQAAQKLQYFTLTNPQATAMPAVIHGSPPVMLALQFSGGLVMVSLRPATTKHQLATQTRKCQCMQCRREDRSNHILKYFTVLLPPNLECLSGGCSSSSPISRQLYVCELHRCRPPAAATSAAVLCAIAAACYTHCRALAAMLPALSAATCCGVTTTLTAPILLRPMAAASEAGLLHVWLASESSLALHLPQAQVQGQTSEGRRAGRCSAGWVAVPVVVPNAKLYAEPLRQSSSEQFKPLSRAQASNTSNMSEGTGPE